MRAAFALLLLCRQGVVAWSASAILPAATRAGHASRAAVPARMIEAIPKDRPTAFLGSTFGSNSAMFYRQGTLVLEDGTRLRGVSFGCEKPIAGELVFTTGMVGYPETLTDPSYKGQILVMTYPIVGNYGVPNDEIDQWGLPKFFESERVQARHLSPAASWSARSSSRATHAAAKAFPRCPSLTDSAPPSSLQVSGLIISDYSHHHSHWNSKRSLSQWLIEQGVPALYGIDTRLLTKKIRSKGALRATIEFDPAVALGGAKAPTSFIDVNKINLVAEVSIKEPRVFNKGGKYKVLATDCGIKYNIIRSLLQRDCEVTLVPWDTPLKDRLKEADGLFLSNGPGDPAMLSKTVEHIKEAIEAMESGEMPMKPLFGICLGNQLLGMAAGASTYKLPFGNRGQNQPVINLINKRCFITPQNHGYALDATQLPEGWVPIFENRNDGSNEGIMHTERPWITAQFHPEAKSGPSDTAFLFDLFIKAMEDPRIPLKKTLSVGEYTAPEPQPLTKVLLLGSGGLSIGQAGEFDYSGSQAIKALKEEGLEVILINPNIASVQVRPAAIKRPPMPNPPFGGKCCGPCAGQRLTPRRRTRPCGPLRRGGGRVGCGSACCVPAAVARLRKHIPRSAIAETLFRRCWPG
jgi:carbamoyl-phosphate synthase small subunit